MKKTLLFISLMFAAVLPFVAKSQTAPPGEWRLHNTWHRFHKKIIDTPDKVYHLAYGIGYWDWSTSYGTEYPMLFVYDKKEDLIEGYNAKNYLHGNIIKDMWYNAAKKYFVVVYDDFNIDLLYTDDRCYNVPGLASAIIPGSKDINSVTFDPANNRAYVGTKFGYMVIDDSKNVITESHLYGNNIKSIARVGDYLLAATDDGFYKSEVKRNDKHSSWSAFTKVEDAPNGINNILTQTGDNFLYLSNDNHVFKGSIDPDGNIVFDTKDLVGTNIVNYHEIKDGYFMRTGWEGVLVDRNGNVNNISGSDPYRNNLYSSSNGLDIWQLVDEQGLERISLIDGKWSNKPSPTYGQYIKANVPSVFDAASFDYSSKHGMLATNAAYAHYHGDFAAVYFFILSTYKDGTWIGQTPFLLSGRNYGLVDSHAGVFDPNDEDIVWVGTGNNRGLTKYNVETYSAKVFRPGGSASYANVSTPKFDADGTLWTIRTSPSSFYYWKKDDRLKENSSGLKSLPFNNFPLGNFPIFLAGTTDANKNMLVASKGSYSSGLLVYDHRGTLEDTSDDRVVTFESLRDQDGQAININYVYAMMEDPATGYVWVGGEGGLYWFKPTEAFNSDFHVNRVKVARNDGTGLADYLLEGSNIFSMGIDGAGHKWFGTLGNGVVETTANGSEIIRQLTRENSYLPSNEVLAIGFEPDSNCVWLGTKNGIAQYFSETSPGKETLDEVLAYPNPVRPEYYGHVTIKGLMDDSLVKILDASGSLVRELGRSEGGMILWDLTNSAGRRVPTGVYYVAVSSTGDNSDSTVTKILVMN